ncbi:MAG TPA: gliding motility-associated C-terminal domain-containing protein [Flavobacteriales bacterium]|nr:gliding motility-associated C-terminal domain-containing protein [Flavobacteriales bacterium]
MFKVFLNIVLFCLFLVPCRAQVNLIPNPGFEILDSCFGTYSTLGFDVFQWSNCIGWSNPTYASSDLWCKDPVSGIWEPPHIGGDFQYPKEGNAMAGIFVNFIAYPNYREYIQSELTSSLKEGYFYRFGIFINSSGTTNYTSCFGAYFSNTALNQPGLESSLPLIPQIENEDSNFITDTLGWQLFEGVFKATGGEKFVTIGCFDDSSKIILTNPPDSGGIYFFLDEISVNELDAFLQVPNVFSPNGDGINDEFFPEIVNIQNWHCNVFNRWGQLMVILDENNKTWNGKNTRNALCSEGVYYYVFTGYIERKEEKQRGFIQLVR